MKNISVLTGNLQQPFLLLTLESKKVKNTINFVVRYLLHFGGGLARLPETNVKLGIMCLLCKFSQVHLLTSPPLSPQQSQCEKILLKFCKTYRQQQGHSVINLTNRKIRMTFTNQKSQNVNRGEYIDIKLFRHFGDKTSLY